MLLIYGRRTARIRRYTDNQQACKSCKSFDLDVKVFRDYYHLFFIPAVAVGEKTVRIRCKNCTEPFNMAATQKHYEDITRTPFYLYTLAILLVGILSFLVIANIYTQKEKTKFVENPSIGDVYQVRKNENNSTSYYFLKVTSIKGDTVVVYHNNLVYTGFVIKLNDEDYFVKDDELIFSKNELKQMLERAEINSVERGYGDEEGFNRVK